MPVSQNFNFLQVFLFLGLYDVTESGRPGAEAPPTSCVCVAALKKPGLMLHCISVTFRGTSFKKRHTNSWVS